VLKGELKLSIFEKEYHVQLGIHFIKLYGIKALIPQMGEWPL
jgi:hypothetical protein